MKHLLQALALSSIKVTYCGYYDKNNQLLKNKPSEWDDAKFYITPILDQLFETYSHECKEFFGISLQQLFKDMKIIK